MLQTSTTEFAPDVVRTDSVSRQWLEALRADGNQRAAATERLHELLLRAARFEVERRTAELPFATREHLDDLATQAAGAALDEIVAKLDGFRGGCRFTTWAYKFALFEAAVTVRRRAWEGREVVLDADDGDRVRTAAISSGAHAECGEPLASILDCIVEVLTPHQRKVLIALTVDGVPIDVLADRLSTSRGALYKTLHDARRKLRAELSDRGISIPG